MNNVSYSMSDRHYDIAFAKQMYKPGPGTHDPARMLGSPRVKIGTSRRQPLGADKETLGKPGPNIYNQTLDPVILSKPKYSFGTGRRKGYQLSDAPGPGAYATDGFIGVLGKGSRRKTFGLTIDLDPHKKE